MFYQTIFQLCILSVVTNFQYVSSSTSSANGSRVSTTATSPLSNAPMQQSIATSFTSIDVDMRMILQSESHSLMASSFNASWNASVGNSTNFNDTLGNNTTGNLTILQISSNATTQPGIKVSEEGNQWCDKRTTWNEGWLQNPCYTKACAQATFAEFNRYMSCNKPRKTDDIFMMAQRISEYNAALSRAFIGRQSVDVLSTVFESYATQNFLAGVGYINKQKSVLTDRTIVPDPLDNSVHSWPDFKDRISISRVELQPGVTTYSWVIFEELRPKNELQTFTEDKSDLEEEIEKFYTFEKIAAKTVLNSHFISIDLNPPFAGFGDYIQITIGHLELKQRKNHKCVTFIGSLGSGEGYWTTKGCHSFYSDRFQSVCRCEQVGIYGVISEIDEDEPDAVKMDRTIMTTFCAAAAGFGIILVLSSMLLPIKYDCLHLPRVKLHFAIDGTLMLEYILFTFGVFMSDNLAASKIVASLLNFIHLSVMGWVLSEGIHCYNSIVPVYDVEVVNPMFFYGTVSVGIPAAFAGACSGYPYNFTNDAEFSWISVRGNDIYYFMAGPIVIVLLTAAVVGLIAYELSSWIGSKSDYVYKRAVEYIKRCYWLILMLATWLTGIAARNNIGQAGYSYIFVSLLITQGIASFSFHFLKNTEIWEYQQHLRDKQNKTKTPEEDPYAFSMSQLSFAPMEFVEKPKEHIIRYSSTDTLNREYAKEGSSQDSTATARRKAEFETEPELDSEPDEEGKASSANSSFLASESDEDAEEGEEKFQEKRDGHTSSSSSESEEEEGAEKQKDSDSDEDQTGQNDKWQTKTQEDAEEAEKREDENECNQHEEVENDTEVREDGENSHQGETEKEKEDKKENEAEKENSQFEREAENDVLDDANGAQNTDEAENGVDDDSFLTIDHKRKDKDLASEDHKEGSNDGKE